MISLSVSNYAFITCISTLMCNSYTNHMIYTVFTYLQDRLCVFSFLKVGDDEQSSMHVGEFQTLLVHLG